MSKQVEFFATENDRAQIVKILNSVLDVPIEVPYYFSSNDFEPLTEIRNNGMYYISELSRKEDILYKPFYFIDNTEKTILKYRDSPVLEYDVDFKNDKGEYVESRFYYCSEDKDFSKKVSRFFAKLKKEFRYVKKWKTYVSKNIDVENSLFFIPNRTVRISEEDLS